jgi:hypothetical protein
MVPLTLYKIIELTNSLDTEHKNWQPDTGHFSGEKCASMGKQIVRKKT